MPAPPTDLVLHRLVLVTFTPAPEGWRNWCLKGDGIEVAPIRHWENEDGSLTSLVAASQVLDYRPNIDADNLAVVPEKQRVAAEEALETAANMVAVAQGLRRHISSPEPCVVFVATGDDGRQWLAERAGRARGPARPIVSAGGQVKLGEEALNDLNTRTDGVALLVEAMAQDHALGQFGDYIRLFERAFKLSAAKLTAPVVGFLNPRLGYTNEEVAVWFEQLRDPATHADQRNEFLLERDVLPYIERIEQAAVDVLMNKANWRSPDSERREVWKPSAGTFSPRGDVFMTEGQEGSIVGRLRDEFETFPLNLDGFIPSLPPQWWPQPPDDGPATE